MARRIALDVLYEAAIRDSLPLDSFRHRQAAGWAQTAAPQEDEPESMRESADPPPEIIAYARSLVAGVQDHQAEIDEMIARYADRWALDRMPIVDKSLLRMGVFELLWGQEIPVAVAINEAVELAKFFSTDDSGRFINGLLGRVVEEMPHEDPGELPSGAGSGRQ
ncbi:MAG: transcription antitermination protein NusB [Actinomycetota bacterium]|nr:transcription antitermination protein NusB [Actinomycetota bacterium]